MVVTSTANQPITFSGQIVAYGAGVANISQSSIKIETANTPLRFSNSQGTVQYSPSTGTPVVYTPV
jgi:hypothetical protein